MDSRGFLEKAVIYAALLAVWQIAASIAHTQWLVGPLDVVAVAAEPSFLAKLSEAYLYTMTRAMTGLVLGLGAGLSIGLLIGYYTPTLRGLAETVSTVFAAVPAVAWIPVLIVAVGVDQYRLPILASFMCSFPPILYQTLAALKSLDPEELAVAQTLGAEGLYLWKTIVVPRVVEKIYPAVKIEAAMTWKTVFVTEMLVASSGLGYLAMIYADLLDMPHLLAVVAVLTSTLIAIIHFLSYLESKTLTRRGLGVEKWASISGYGVHEY